MRVRIVGLGLMGGSFALALRSARPELELVGTDTDQNTMRLAAGRGLVSATDAREADVVVLAAPIPALPEILSSLRGTSAVVTDMASTKVRVMGWAAAAGVDLVGGHPMCGREQAGIRAADPQIFHGAPWILTRDHRTVTELVQAVGAIPVFMDAARHDRLVAGVSHVAFMLSVAYVLALADQPDWPDMRAIAGPGFRDVSRLAAGDPELYGAIVSTNGECIAEAMRWVEASLARLRRHIHGQGGRLVELFEEARRVRERWAQTPS